MALSLLIIVTAFLSHSEVHGMNKICYYNFGTSVYSINIGYVQICPLHIKVDA
jgi:hypothetical protein